MELQIATKTYIYKPLSGFFVRMTTGCCNFGYWLDMEWATCNLVNVYHFFRILFKLTTSLKSVFSPTAIPPIGRKTEIVVMMCLVPVMMRVNLSTARSAYVHLDTPMVTYQPVHWDHLTQTSLISQERCLLLEQNLGQWVSIIDQTRLYQYRDQERPQKAWTCIKSLVLYPNLFIRLVWQSL